VPPPRFFVPTLTTVVELGLTPAEALRTATLVAAERLRREGTTGAIEPGLLVVSNGRVALDRLDFSPR
jgi:imidazolonepropionase-like amidohydrolase